MSRRTIVAGLVLALAVAGMPSAGQAQAYSAQAVKDDCRKSDNKGEYYLSGLCLGFIAGVFDSAAIRKSVCVPKGVTVGQVVDVARKYLDEHPEHGHFAAAEVVEYALKQVWPCR